MMNKKLISFFIIGSLIYSNSLFAMAQKKQCPSQETLRALADHTIKALPPVAGVSIAISNPDCGEFTYTSGEANVEKHYPMTSETKLPIASNTKPILIALALMIIEENPALFPNGLSTKLTDITDIHHQRIFSADAKLTLENGRVIDLADPDYYKSQTGKSFDCATDSIYQCPQLDKIDLNHVLLESSGLADEYQNLDLTHTGTPDVFEEMFAKLFSPLPDPGSRDTQTDIDILKKYGVIKRNNPDPIIPAQSHNTDALLLSIILERTTGKTLNELLVQRILLPLGLKTDSMYFLTTPSSADDKTSRRYAYLNTDEEIEQAIANNTLVPSVTPHLARLFKPTLLKVLGRHIIHVGDRPAIDILDLHGQGFIGISGAGGIMAQPKAYIRFYQALINGSLLSPHSQALFDASFIPQTSPNPNYKLATGFGSNDYMESLSQPEGMRFVAHGGFVLGAESKVVYHYDTHTTIMIVSDFTAHYRKKLPTFFVTATPYFNIDAMFNLATEYAKLY